MRRAALWGITIGALASAGLFAAQACAGESERGCILATLHGQYLFNGSGTLFPPAFGVTSVSTGTSAGFHIFNGDGKGTDFVAFSIDGVVVVPSSTSPITYTLNHDCTGTYTVPDAGLQFDIFVAVDGSALTTIAAVPDGIAFFWGPQPRVGSSRGE